MTGFAQVSNEERRAANLWLLSINERPDALNVWLEVLRRGTNKHTLLSAATMIRTKIVRDGAALAPSSLPSLCSTLLEAIAALRSSPSYRGQTGGALRGACAACCSLCFREQGVGFLARQPGYWALPPNELVDLVGCVADHPSMLAEGACPPDRVREMVSLVAFLAVPGLRPPAWMQAAGIAVPATWSAAAAGVHLNTVFASLDRWLRCGLSVGLVAEVPQLTHLALQHANDAAMGGFGLEFLAMAIEAFTTACSKFRRHSRLGRLAPGRSPGAPDTPQRYLAAAGDPAQVRAALGQCVECLAALARSGMLEQLARERHVPEGEGASASAADGAGRG